jgi:hypothetical protein
MSYIQNRITSVVPIGGVATLTGNTGGAISPTAGNINILGAGIISVAGAGSTLTISASGDLDYAVTLTSTTPYVVTATDQIVGIDSTGAIKTVQLPNAPSTGRWITIKDAAGTAAAFNITVTTVGGVVLIDGAATFTMNSAYQSVTVVFDGTKYLII